MATERPHCEYTHSEDFEVDAGVLKEFEEYGYIILRKLLDGEELRLLLAALESDEGIVKHAYRLSDGKQKTSLCIWNQPGRDITGMVARVRKTALTMQKLLGDEVYHYHTKLMMKNAGEGGWNWHQDYGYWYHNGCLFPDMGTVFIAVDPSRKENGCLRVIEGSHRVGRVEHEPEGGQMMADRERVGQLQGVFTTRYVELEPGDALFFHCNVLHTSSPNTSDKRRWAFLVAYNTRHNDPTKAHHHPKYTKLDIVDNDAIKKCTDATCMEGKDFFVPGAKQYGKHELKEE